MNSYSEMFTVMRLIYAFSWMIWYAIAYDTNKHQINKRMIELSNRNTCHLINAKMENILKKIYIRHKSSLIPLYAKLKYYLVCNRHHRLEIPWKMLSHLEKCQIIVFIRIHLARQSNYKSEPKPLCVCVLRATLCLVCVCRVFVVDWHKLDFECL